MTVRGSFIALVALLGSHAGATAAPASGTAPATLAAPRSTPPSTTPADLAARADAIADDVVARWVARQRDDGRFPDPIAGGGEDYGTAMLGLAIARRAAERGDRTLIRRGLEAILAQVERPTGGAFEPMVLAEAYRWGNQTLAGRADLRDLWDEPSARLRADLTARPPAGSGIVAERCLADPDCWSNLKLVGALASRLLLTTGLRSATEGALLADPALPDQVTATLAGRIPAETGRSITRSGASGLVGAGMLSDPTRNPLAYHALSTAYLGRLVDDLGDGAPPAAREALDRASRGLLLLAAPNGDLTWWGRGQGQVWVPAAAAEAAARAARRAAPNGKLRGRYLAVAAAQLDRLRRDYGVGVSGMPLVPGAVDPETLRTRSLDPYATTRTYNGLAVDALDRTAALLAATGAGRPATSVPSTRPGAVRSPSQAGIAAITRGDRWVALSARDRASEDARYGSGLLAMQARGEDGRWTDRVARRPRSAERVATIAVRSAGELLPAAGVIVPERRSDAITVLGRWGRPGGTRGADEGTRWRWTMESDGRLRVSWRAKRARTVVVTALAGDGETARRTADGVDVVRRDGTFVRYAVRVNGRVVELRRTRRALGGSAYDAAVRGLEVATPVRAGARVSVTIRAAGAPPVAGG